MVFMKGSLSFIASVWALIPLASIWRLAAKELGRDEGSNLVLFRSAECKQFPVKAEDIPSLVLLPALGLIFWVIFFFFWNFYGPTSCASGCREIEFYKLSPPTQQWARSSYEWTEDSRLSHPWGFGTRDWNRGLKKVSWEEDGHGIWG